MRVHRLALMRQVRKEKAMTQKEIITMASSFECQWRLNEIAMIQTNMCHKTVYEQARAKRRMHEYAKAIQDILKRGEDEQE